MEEDTGAAVESGPESLLPVEISLVQLNADRLRKAVLLVNSENYLSLSR